MIRIENTEVYGWQAAITGMRNPLNSWHKSDSGYGCDEIIQHLCNTCEAIHTEACGVMFPDFIVGKNDLELMQKLIKAGNDHSKFMRMIVVTCDITAPLYWWKEADTYKVGTVANSCSTMHKIHAKEFELSDFSHEHLGPPATQILKHTIKCMNDYREEFLKDGEKYNWWQMIQLLPSSYNQKRTWQANYAVLRNIYHSRKNHKLQEWRDFCKWIENEIPYAKELITDEQIHEEKAKEKDLHEGGND